MPILIISIQSREYQQDIHLNIGFTQITLDNYLINQNSEHLQIKLLAEQDSLTQLLVCNEYPKDDSFDFEQIDNKYGCIYPINHENKKTIILNYKYIPKLYNYLFNQYSIINEQQYAIIAYSLEKITIKVSIIILNDTICFSECKNGGFCKQGLCQCPNGYIGSDCNYQIIELQNNQELNQDVIYYLNSENVNDQLDLQLSQEYPYQMMCYLKLPIFNQYPIYKSDIIRFYEADLQECKCLSQDILFITEISIPPYIIIKLKSNQNQNTDITAIVVGSVCGFGGLIFLVVIAYKIYEQDVFKERLKQKLELIDRIIEQFMPKILLDESKQQMLETKECIVCLQEYKDKEYIRFTYCKHCYHDKCLISWLHSHNTCPMCRSNLDLKTLEQHHDLEMEQHDHNKKLLQSVQ